MSRKKKKKKAFQPIPRERALVLFEPQVPLAPPEPKEEPAEEHPKKVRMKKKRHWGFWIAAGFFVMFISTAVFLFDVPHWQMLDVNKLTKLAQTSRMYDRNGMLITKLRGPENRTLVKLSQIPVDVQNAFIAAEDLRFYQHHGFDLVRIFGALVADLRSQSYGQGASTITQQLIKLTHLSDIKTFARKGEELFLAIQAESSFSKEEILEMYLNTVYFGGGAHGIEVAAEQFFGKKASELTVTEGAALAATIKAPSAYSPTVSEETNKTRRDYILRTMMENGLLKEEEGQAALQENLTLAEQTSMGLVHGWFVDTVLEEAEKVLGLSADDVLSGGYFIETTMDPTLQTFAEELFANAKNFPSNASDGTKVQGAMAVVNVKTGGYLAMVGGREYMVQRGFNRATDMRRSPGSAIKPLAVYAPAIERGYTTASIILDEREDFGGGYTPRNSGNVYHGPVALRRALALSMNVATVRLMKEIGVNASISFLKRAGIPLTETDANLSLALGAMTTGITPAELAASYALFGNGGIYNEGYSISRIYGPGGDVVYEHRSAPRTVLNPQDNYLMMSMMQSVTNWGTGAKLSATGLSVAGKTGTNSLVGQSGNRDVWMAAFTSDYSLACWMGFDNTDATHHLPSRVSGGDAPAAMAAAFLRSAYRDKTKPSFSSPGGLVWLTIDTAASAASGSPMLAGSYTPDSYKLSEVFRDSNRPWKTSNIWQVPKACSYFYIDYETSGHPKLVFGAADSANYRVERIRNGSSMVITELYGAAGQTMTYTDWSAMAGEWYTYRVTPIHTAMLEAGVLLEGPSSSQSVQAKAAFGDFVDGVLRWLVNSGA